MSMFKTTNVSYLCLKNYLKDSLKIKKVASALNDMTDKDKKGSNQSGLK